MTFNSSEQALIQRSKDLEEDAKTLRRDAERLRRERLEREAKQADSLRVRDFLRDVSAAGVKHGFKFEGVDNTWSPAPPRPDLDFVLIDSRKPNRITVTPVAGYGFKWTDGKAMNDKL